MSLRLIYSFVPGEFEEALKEKYRPIAEAAQGAIVEIAAQVKTEARADIAAAGFSTKWQNALRVDVFPKRGASANAAAFLYHKIPYAGVFETGATIQGKPRLWIPLSSAPKKLGGKRFSVAAYVSRYGQSSLKFVPRGGKPPLLVGRPVGARSKNTQAVPLFVGVESVTVRDRFSIREICERASQRLASLYFKHLKGE